MRNKLRLLNVPYVIWMALFTVAPIIMVVLYAFSTGDAQGSLGVLQSVASQIVRYD